MPESNSDLIRPIYVCSIYYLPSLTFPLLMSRFFVWISYQCTFNSLLEWQDRSSLLLAITFTGGWPIDSCCHPSQIRKGIQQIWLQHSNLLPFTSFSNLDPSLTCTKCVPEHADQVRAAATQKLLIEIYIYIWKVEMDNAWSKIVKKLFLIILCIEYSAWFHH